MFIEKITICNLFAYYGKIEVDFIPHPNKNIYCIYGNNGVGKTSFIRCAKLLFLGSGSLDENSKIPEVVEKFIKSNKFVSPLKFIEGTSYWDGILNKRAVEEKLKEFYISFEGKISDKSFRLQRSWNGINIRQYNESLELEINGEIFKNKDAQDRINNILPSDFIDFFFFDGEEIEDMTNNLHSSLREKITSILKINPLNIIIKQINNIQDDLIKSQIEDRGKKESFKQKIIDFEQKKDRIENLKQNIEDLKTLLEIKHKEKEDAYRRLEKITADESDRHKDLQNNRNNQVQKINEVKDELSDLLKSIMISSNPALIKKVKKELEDLDSKAQKPDIEAYKRLLPEIKNLLEGVSQKEFGEFKSIMTPKISNFLDNVPKNLENKFFSESKINISSISILKESIARVPKDLLRNKILDILNTKKELKNIDSDINNIEFSETSKEKQNKIREEKEEIEKQINKLNQDLENAAEEKGMIKKDLDDLEREIKILKQTINTERIDLKSKILATLANSIEAYKKELIKTLRNSLHDKILKNYKSILSNDNIYELEIDEEFKIALKNINNENINIANQSSGQKQILAISIFWALSELSHSNIPLIIDTPLSRIDRNNRRQIIEKYYAKNLQNSQEPHQVIILPHDGEMGSLEYKYAEPYLAGLYEIKNSNDRQHARIVCETIENILSGSK